MKNDKRRQYLRLAKALVFIKLILMAGSRICLACGAGAGGIIRAPPPPGQKTLHQSIIDTVFAIRKAVPSAALGVPKFMESIVLQVLNGAIKQTFGGDIKASHYNDRGQPEIQKRTLEIMPRSGHGQDESDQTRTTVGVLLHRPQEARQHNRENEDESPEFDEEEEEETGEHHHHQQRQEDAKETGHNPIACGTQLSCTFDTPCRWHDDFSTDLRIYNGTGKPDQQILDVITGIWEVPTSPYVIAIGAEKSKGAWLVSDPISSQPGTAVLELKAWLTTLIQLRICTRDVGNKTFTYCSTPFESGTGKESPWKAAKIPGPIDHPFEIVLEVANFVIAPGGMAIIDDIIYHDFTDCVNPDDNSTVTAATLPPWTESSTTIPAFEFSSTTLDFQSFSTAMAASGFSSPIVASSPVESQAQAPVENPPAPGPPVPVQFGGSFKSVDPSGVNIFLDNSQPQSEALSQGAVSSVDRSVVVACQRLTCDFSAADTCQYQTEGVSDANSFRRQTGSYGPISTDADFAQNGIPGGFLIAGGGNVGLSADAISASPSEATLRSSEFTVDSVPIEVQFYRWQSSANVQLSICLNSRDFCFRNYRETTSSWTLTSFRIDPEDAAYTGSQRVSIIFLVENGAPNEFVGIDSIQVNSGLLSPRTCQ